MIYLVMEHDIEHDDVIGVFSSRALAEERQACGWKFQYTIHEWDLVGAEHREYEYWALFWGQVQWAMQQPQVAA